MRFAGSRILLYAATFAMPAVLLFSAIRTFRELDAQREVYLRERAARIAGRLEAASAQNQPLESAVASLIEDEPHLRDLRIFSNPPEDGNSALEAVWSGRVLFHTGFVSAGDRGVYRAYVPFHAGGVMHVAQIDVDSAAADFLAVHGRHNVMIATASGIALILLSLYSIWASRRSALLERRQLEMQHMAHLGTMAAVLAHEIRNPLGSIKGFTQLALERGGDPSLLAPVVDQTQRLESLVNDLLVYGRPPSPSIRTVQWPEFAARIETQARRIAASRGVQISIDRPRVSLATDPDLLEQILINLIRNAVEAAESVQDPRVHITAELDGGHVELAVRDNGPGIDESTRGKVLEPFFTTKAFGTGLGLPVSARLTKALGGAFRLGPSNGGGAIASLRLPAK
jgi:two-component system sensor histidine kinase HydH